MTHFHVLTLLRHHDAMPMGRLAEILDASMSSTTGIIDRMEEKGLVERVRVPDDRRIVLVRSTAAGLALIDEAELVKSEIIVSAISRLDPDAARPPDRSPRPTSARRSPTPWPTTRATTHLPSAATPTGPSSGPPRSAVRASNLHGSPTPTPQSRDTIDVAPAQPAHTVARYEPALKEG